MNKKELRSGYTTGTCASVATYIALSVLLERELEKVVKVMSLDGIELSVPVHSYKKGSNWARGVVIKDAGDDPDVTNGIEICAKVKIVEEFPEKSRGHYIDNILILGGRGVGLATKKGLKVSPGKSAINPGPQEMIKRAVQSLVGKDIKVQVEIYVPQGMEKAKKTFNGKLGILRGISILGSTGIVKPMSEEALTKSMYEELKVLKANTDKNWAIFAFGNHGKRFCEENELNLEHMVVTSNYMGFMIDSAVELGFKKIMLIGHIGKAIKVAGGIFNTHSRVADARLEILAANAFIVDEKRENILKVLDSNTAEEACAYIEKKEVFNLICNKVAKRCKEHSRDEIEFQGMMFTYSGDILGYSDDFYKMVEDLRNES